MSSKPAAHHIASWNRIDGVDLLRGLAIFFVLMNHVNIRLLIANVPDLAKIPTQLAHLLVWNGQYGVQMFFAVSGFLITSTSLRRWGSLANIDVKDFYKLRFARIAPLFVALLCVLSVLHFAHVENYIVTAKTGGLGRALLAALTFHVNVLEARRGYLPGNWDVMWSLSVEEMFYLFFPLACWLLARRKIFVPLLWVFVVLGPFGRTVWAHGNKVWQEYSYLGSMDAIALGCLTAMLVKRARFSRRALLIFGAAGVAILTFVLGFSVRVYALGLGRTGLDMSVLAVGTCLIIIVSAQTQWKSSPLLWPLLNIGGNSYEIYLTHMFVVFTCFGVFVRVGKPMGWVAPLFIAVVLISGVMGSAVAHFYSEPSNRRLRAQFGYRAKGTLVAKAHQPTH